MSDRDRYDGKYGENTKTWTNKTEGGTPKQYNVKDVDTGDHYFTNIETGVMGTALGDYRPFRDSKNQK